MCKFCDLINDRKEISCVYESNDAIAFLDIDEFGWVSSENEFECSMFIANKIAEAIDE